MCVWVGGGGGARKLFCVVLRAGGGSHQGVMDGPLGRWSRSDDVTSRL